MPQLISVTPDPPVAGQNMTVCYDFDGTGLTETHLDVHFNPAGGSVGVHLTTVKPCATIRCPDGAGGVAIEDQDGQSDDWMSPVTPP